MTTDNQQQQQAPADQKPADENADSKPIVQKVADDAGKDKPLADPVIAKLGDAWLKDGQPDLEKIASALGRVHTDLPEEGKDYELAFPKEFDLKGADGEVVKLDPTDPIVGAFKEVAKKHHMGQGAVSDLMGLYGDIIKTAYSQNAEEAKAKQDAEYATLDPDRKKAEERASAAVRGLQKAFGKNAALAAPLIESMTTAAHVKAIEALIEIVNGTSTANPKPNGGSRKSPLEILYPQQTGA